MKVTEALKVLSDHIEIHSNNKYQNSMLDTDRSLYQPTFTLLTAHKYIARYLAFKGEKNGNPQDLLKAIHFILFEVQNRLPVTPIVYKPEDFAAALDELATKYGFEVTDFNTKKK